MYSLHKIILFRNHDHHVWDYFAIISGLPYIFPYIFDTIIRLMLFVAVVKITEHVWCCTCVDLCWASVRTGASAVLSSRLCDETHPTVQPCQNV